MLLTKGCHLSGEDRQRIEDVHTRAHKRFRSQEWFDNPNNPGMTALYLERYLNQEYTREELQGDKPVISIAQTGSDIAPCNKIHVFLMTG